MERSGHNGPGSLEARVPQNEVSGLYDGLARFYDVWGKLAESKARNRAIEIADIRDGQNIMEIAVGTGLAFYEIVKRNPHGLTIGIDLSEGMLRKAQKRLKQLSGARHRLEVGTAFRLPAHNESTDLLVNNYMFDLIHSDEMDKILAEFRRVLSKDGRLVLVNMTKHEGCCAGLYESTYGWIYRLWPRAMGGCRGVQLSGRLEAHGFEVERREYYRQLLFPSEVILAHKRRQA